MFAKRLLASALLVALRLQGQSQPAQPVPAEPSVKVAGHKALGEAGLYHAPALAEKASLIGDFTINVGSLRLEFKKGVACPVLVGGKVRGLYLQGAGGFRYLAGDPVTRRLLQFNLKENTAITPTAAGSALGVGEPVTEAILWFIGRELPVLPAPTEPAPLAAFQATWAYYGAGEKWMGSPMARILSLVPIGQLAAYQAANDPGKPIVMADLVGEKEHWVYTHDPVRSRLESLFIQRPSVVESGIAYTDLIPVDYAPIGWTRKAPVDPDFRLAHIDLDLVATNRTYAKLKVEETIQVIRPGLRILSFRMRDRESSTGALGQDTLLKSGVWRVRLNGQQDLAFLHRGGNLTVDLGRTATNGETLKLTFEAKGDMLRLSSQYDLWRLTPDQDWFPEPDLSGQSYTVKARIAVEKPFVAIVSAKTLSRSATDTHNVVEVSLDKPTLWFSVAAGKYESREMVKNGRTVRAWGYSGIGQGADQLLKTAHGFLEFYSLLLGSAPFDEVNLVEYPSYGFGQAPAGMIWLTREAFDAISSTTNRLVASRGAVGGWVNRLVAHELAHQYWGHQLKMWGYEDQWITESFAEYTSALAMRQLKNKGQDTYEIIVKDWEDDARKASQAATIPTANLLHPALRGGDPNAGRYRKDLLYSKGAFLLACLHKDLGEQKFVQFLRVYLKKFPWYPPSYNQDIPDTLKEVTGKDYLAWMDKYFYGTEMPEWKP